MLHLLQRLGLAWATVLHTGAIAVRLLLSGGEGHRSPPYSLVRVTVIYERNPSCSGLDPSFDVRETRTTCLTVSLSRTRNKRPELIISLRCRLDAQRYHGHFCGRYIVVVCIREHSL